MMRYRSLPVLAIRRMLGNWRLLSSVVVGTLVAAAILSATAIFADAIRDLGLQFALRQRPLAALDVTIGQGNVSVSAVAYERSRGRQDVAVARVMHGAVEGATRGITSATFYPAPAGAKPRLEDAARPRANIVVRSALRDHVTVVQGAYPGPMPSGGSGAIMGLIGADTARANGLKVGDTFDLYPYWDEQAAPVKVEVAGIARPSDPRERYWGRAGRALDVETGSWPTYLVFVPEATFFGALLERQPTLAADYENQYAVRHSALNARLAKPIADGIAALPGLIEATEGRPQVNTDLEVVLRTFDQKLFFTRIPLFVVLLQVGGIVAYYLVMVSTMLIERQGAEIATLHSRGATTRQLLAQYGVEGVILALLAALLGPPIAAAAVSALGPTPAFASLSGGGPLPVHIGGAAYWLAAGGALLAFGSLMLPAWRATRVTVLEFKRAAARPPATPLFLRYYLDVALVGVLALAFWRLSRDPNLVTRTLFGGTKVDPFLLATPAVFMLTVGIVFLRLFPLVLRAVAWLLGKTRSVSVLVGMRSLVRNPTHYTRLILLLMFATGVGMFGATFSATIERSYDERARYAVGADFRASNITGALGLGNVAFTRAIERVPADASTPVLRVDATAFAGKRSADVEVLAVDPATFGRVAFFRDDFAGYDLEEMLATLAQDASPAAETWMLPAGAQQLGVWLKLNDIRGRVVLGVSLEDAAGRTVNRSIGDVRPGEPATQRWTFFSVDLRPLTPREAPLTSPLRLHGVYFAPTAGIASQRGSILVGPALATTAPPSDENAGLAPVGSRSAAAAWPGATIVRDFALPGVEVAQGLRPVRMEDVTRAEADAPPGFARAMRYDWQDTATSPQRRGLRPVADTRPVALYLSRDAARNLELRTGDAIVVAISGRYVDARLAGVFDYFPTYTPGRAGFAVLNAPRLLANLSAALVDRTADYGEAWYATHDVAATRAGLARLEARTIGDRAAVRLQQQEDPLIAAGWSGILAIAFGAVLLLSAIGFMVYSYLTAQQRALEFAILRTLGFSRPQVVSLVLFEHLFVIAAGMGLGTVVGLRVGRLMMGLLGIDERGGQVVPPFIQRVDWVEVFVVWGILGTVFAATIAAVVALYFRLALSRALRIGDI